MQTLSLQAAYVVPARDPQYFLSMRSVANENQSELRGFNTLFHQNSIWNRSSGHCFPIICGLVFQ